MPSPHATTEFSQEFEAETGLLLRRRFLWCIATVGVVYLIGRIAAFALYGLVMVASAADIASDQMLKRMAGEVLLGRAGMWLVLAFTVIDIAIIVWCAVHVSRKRRSQQDLVRFTQNTFMFLGVSQIAFSIIMQTTGFPWLIGLYHVIACVFLPWTPRQALRPIGPLLLLNAIIVLIFGDAAGTLKAFIILMSIFAAAPGTLIAWFKHSRRMEHFRVRMLQARYGQMRRELFDARRIHEALFPPPVQTGPLRFEYRYVPMLQIGGDYLYARFSPSRNGSDRPGPFNLLLMDVTGHGIAAALTVNRLYGEVERLFAEDPHTGPGEVLTALNRYVHLTLANHSIYVTALCIRIDLDADLLEYASGGHPPAFLCSVDGRLDQLDSTSFVLGAAAGPDFDPAVERRTFGPGDSLLAYTDGALECRNQLGRMLGVKGLTRILASVHKPEQAGKSGLASVILAAVDQHRHGPPEDDTLVVEITRTIGPTNSHLVVDAHRERTTIPA